MNRTVPVVLYRASAALLVLFAAGHTFGFLAFRPSTPEGRAVFASMASVMFPAGNRLSSYEQFYVGFGLSISSYLVFLAYLAWYLGRRLKHRPGSANDSLPWMFVVLQAATLVVSVVFFSSAPAAFSAVTLALVFLAAWFARRSARGEPAGVTAHQAKTACTPCTASTIPQVTTSAPITAAFTMTSTGLGS